MADIRKGAKIKLTWTASVSDDVVEQRLTINYVTRVNNPIKATLPPTVNEFTFEAREKDSINATMVVFDGTFVSDPTAINFTLPDLSKPLPITNFAFAILEIFDLPPTPPPDKK